MSQYTISADLRGRAAHQQRTDKAYRVGVTPFQTCQGRSLAAPSRYSCLGRCLRRWTTTAAYTSIRVTSIVVAVISQCPPVPTAEFVDSPLKTLDNQMATYADRNEKNGEIH